MGKSSRARKQRYKLQSYEVFHVTSNGDILVFRVKANCVTEAQTKIDFFLNAVEICSSDASDEEILRFIARNEPSCLSGGGEA